MIEWKQCIIADLGDVVTGKTPSTKNAEFWDGDVHFVTPKDIQGLKHITDTERRITNEGLQKVKGSALPPRAVCVSCIGNIGYTGMTTQKCVSNQQINSIIVNSDNDPDFVYYLMRSLWPFFKNYEGQSTTLSILNKTQFSKIAVTVPDKATQKRIVATLSALDEKIAANTRINDNLQQQAYAYFLQLFIENADSSWPVGTIADLGTVVGGGTPSKAKPEYYTDEGIAWITPKDLSVDKSKFVTHGENDISELGYRNSSATMMPAGTVLFSSRAPIGYIAIASNEVTTNQGFKSVVPRPEIGTPFVYYFLIHNLPLIESKASGSTFKEVSGSVMKSVEAVIPDGDTIAKFNDFCRPVFEMQEKLESENRKLATIRDSLLPRLMSGEIDVSNIDI